jgi:hypothetical protein
MVLKRTAKTDQNEDSKEFDRAVGQKQQNRGRQVKFQFKEGSWSWSSGA